MAVLAPMCPFVKCEKKPVFLRSNQA